MQWYCLIISVTFIIGEKSTISTQSGSKVTWTFRCTYTHTHTHTHSVDCENFLLDTKSQKQISKLWYNSQGSERFNLYNCSSNHTFIIEAKIEKQKRAREREVERRGRCKILFDKASLSSLKVWCANYMQIYANEPAWCPNPGRMCEVELQSEEWSMLAINNQSKEEVVISH